jgi:hypothetical protein
VTLAIGVALAGLLVSIVLGFAQTMRALGRIEQRIDMLWSWYLEECGPGIPGGRRRTDPAAPWSANDHPADRSSSA